MRTVVTAFALGVAAVGALALVIALVAAALADASGREALRVGLGPLVLVEFERSAGGTATTFGPALFVLPLVGGALNAAGAAMLRNRD
jgi:hypothetical protein